LSELTAALSAIAMLASLPNLYIIKPVWAFVFLCIYIQLFLCLVCVCIFSTNIALQSIHVRWSVTLAPVDTALLTLLCVRFFLKYLWDISLHVR
jgi:hypothetical protein